MTTKKELSHAEQNACGWLETIREYVACLHTDRERLEELRDDRDNFEPETDGPEHSWANARAEDAAELAALEKAVTIEGDELDEEGIRERIQESPLSVQVRHGWVSPGTRDTDSEPEEYEILLSTGGPALRIVGALEKCEPSTARLQHQDWGTPWTDWVTADPEDDEALLTFARCFYYGD